MSLGYQRMKMRATTAVVDHVRSFCDGCNVVLTAVGRPFRRVASRINSEAPWVVALGACTFITIIPLTTYPLIKKYVMPDPRAAAEAERVRLCLQKGIDPYPYMRYKDHVYGNAASITATEDQHPDRGTWEDQAVSELLRRKEELRREVGGDINDTVEKLMRLKEQHKALYQTQIRNRGVEPTDLVFQGRKDVDQLKS